MPTYIAMLRGINVSGHKIIPMEKLRKSCETLGLQKVQTYIQSGNIIFQSKKASPAVLSKKISETILRDFGFAVPVILRSPEELDDIVRKNPFLKDKSPDPSQVFVTFLSEKPEKNTLKKLENLPPMSDQIKLIGQELYLYCPNGMGKSKLGAIDFEKLLSVRTTTRNWNTVNKLLDLARSLAQ